MMKQLLTWFLHDIWERTVGRVFFAITSRWVLAVAFVASLLSLWIAYEVPRSGKRLYGFFESLSHDQGFATFLGTVLNGFGKASTAVARFFASVFDLLARPYLDRVLQVAVAFLLVLFALLIVNMLQPLARQIMPKTAPHYFEDPIGPRHGPLAVMLVIFGWSTTFALFLHAPPHWFAMVLGVPVQRADTVFFVWSGLVAVATLVLLRTFARYTPSGVVPSAVPNWTAPPSLKEAYDRLVARNSPELLAHVQLGEYQAGSQKEAEANEVRCSQVAARVGAFYNLDSAATENFDKGLDAVGRSNATQHIGVVIDEPIGPLHVRFFAEAILAAQDRGGTTLILCPESEIEDVKTRFIKAVSEADKGRLQQIWPPSDVDRIDESDYYTFIIASETIVQNRILGDDRAHFAPVLRQVRLLIVLDAAAFDPALLRIQLALLRARLDDQRVRYIVQSTRRRDADGWRYLLGISRKGDPRTANRQSDAPGLLPLRLRRQKDGLGSSAFYCVVFREERTAALRWYEELEPSGMILPPAAGLFPVVLLDVVKPRIRVQHWDPQFSRDATLWEQFKDLLDSRQRPPEGSPDLTWRFYAAGVSRSKQPIIDEPRDADITAASARNAPAHRYPTIWLAEDCHNLLDLIEDLSGVRVEGEAMAIIVTTSYPLRDILADKARVRRVLRGEPDSLAPLAPQPRIGMRELAMLILMRAIDGLPRAEAVRYFRDVADKKVLAQYRFSPTRLGLKNLLEQQFSGGIDGAVHPSGLQFDFDTRPYGHMATEGDDFNDDFAFYLPRHGRVPDGVNPLVPVLLRNDVDGQSVGRVHQDDHGLAYAEKSVILLGGRFYQVRSVEREGQRRVFADPVDPYHRFDIKTGFNFIFWRGYRLGSTSQAPSIVVDDRRTEAWGLKCRISRALVPFIRHSYGFYVNDTGLQTGQTYPPLTPEYLSPDKHARRSTSFGHCFVLRLHQIDTGLLDPGTADRVAFTLAVTLQDLIEALFPGIGHRVAVVSPQAEPAYRELFGSENASLGQVLAHRWPHLIDGFDEDQPIVGNSAQVIGWLNSFAPTAARSSATVGALDIIILEDWGWDLGVIGAVDDKLSRVVEAWHEYLAWNAAHENDPNLYYRMGTSELHEVFAFRAAGEIVSRLRRSPALQQPEPAKPVPP
jgi:hypothetical protein